MVDTTLEQPVLMRSKNTHQLEYMAYLSNTSPDGMYILHRDDHVFSVSKYTTGEMYDVYQCLTERYIGSKCFSSTQFFSIQKPLPVPEHFS
jgi:hypothetical protein